MIRFPHAKINLGLHVTRKREDGYHDIETLFHPLPWQDVLEAKEGPSKVDVMGLVPDGNPDDNLVQKAWKLLKADFDLPEIHWQLLKNIPFGAGLGGGSADGAFALQWLNEQYELGLSKSKLAGYALNLGSDCPFFLHDKPMLGKGRGEELEPVDLDLSGVSAIVVFPGFTVSTAWAFSQLTPAKPEQSITNIIQQPRSTWKSQLTNDFEEPLFAKYPRLAELKAWMYEQGAFYAAMSGSGSAMFGLFEKEVPDPWTVAKQLGLRPEFVWSGGL